MDNEQIDDFVGKDVEVEETEPQADAEEQNSEQPDPETTEQSEGQQADAQSPIDKVLDDIDDDDLLTKGQLKQAIQAEREAQQAAQQQAQPEPPNGIQSDEAIFEECFGGSAENE